MQLTAERLRERLSYDPLTGVFVWRSTGREAGTISISGYRSIGLDKKTYGAHRLAVLYVDDYLPHEVHHKNEQKLDNRYDNLFPCDRSLNNLLKSRSLGVSRKGRKWTAQLKFRGKKKHLGTYPSRNEAINVYRSAKRELLESLLNAA